jgi:hypothetical protein
VGGQLARERERAKLRAMNMGPEQVRSRAIGKIFVVPA